MDVGLVTAFATLFVFAYGQIPIPRREVGFVYKSGSPSAPVHLDFYVDQICPDSKNAWPTILKVADDYGPQKLQLTTHLFPLPYHRNSFYASKGTHIVDELTARNATYSWIEKIYDHIDDLVNSATMDLSDEQIIEKLAMYSEEFGISAHTFKEKMKEQHIEMDTRTEWKYCCTRGVAATPTFLVNDVAVPASPDWSVAKWKDLINPLLQGHYHYGTFQQS